jgi:hypothetical protein
MMVRDPIVSGQFYPDSRAQCLAQIEKCIPSDLDLSSLPSELFGGIVPHAGWSYSGPTAGRVFGALAARCTPATVVLFGADHARATRTAVMFGKGRWAGPLGDATIDDRLAERIMGMTNLITDDPYAHDREHSIEVQIPFLQHIWPEAKILPIIVAPTHQAVEVGKAVARTIETHKADALVVGSTDLTHYGPNYGFTPRGIGSDALKWAKDVNDRRLIDLMLKLDAGGVIPQAATDRSACGAGAVAATIAACRQLGAAQAVLIEHTTSHEVAGRTYYESPSMAVGYAGIVFGQ